MKLSTRLTRACASIVLCGMVTASVPNSGIISAGACDSNGSDFGTVATVAAVGGGLFILAADKKKKKDPDTIENGVPAADHSWSDLRTFEGAGKTIN